MWSKIRSTIPKIIKPVIHSFELIKGFQLMYSNRLRKNILWCLGLSQTKIKYQFSVDHINVYTIIGVDMIWQPCIIKIHTEICDSDARLGLNETRLEPNGINLVYSKISEKFIDPTSLKIKRFIPFVASWSNFVPI